MLEKILPFPLVKFTCPYQNNDFFFTLRNP